MDKLPRDTITHYEHDSKGNINITITDLIRCKNCKHWKQQANYAGESLSFGFCESDEMWRSLYGETYEVSHIYVDDDFYCGYADMRGDTDEDN